MTKCQTFWHKECTRKNSAEATEAVLAKVYTSQTEFTKDVDAVSQFKTELAAGMLE